MNKILIIDPRQSGISGDMLLAVLTGFYQITNEINQILDKLCNFAKDYFGLEANYKVISTSKQNFQGYQLKYTIEKDFPRLNVEEFVIKWKKLLALMNIQEEVTSKIFEAFNTLIDIEKRVHGKEHNPLSDIHFHELNSIDTIIDFSLVFMILHRYYSQKTIYGLPTAIGTGRISFSHGNFSLPAPAVANLLTETNYPITSVDYPSELTTPSGLTLLSSIVTNTLLKFPTSKVIKSEIGLGLRQKIGFPNFLRIWEVESGHAIENNPLLEDQIIVLETHVDDVSGEILGHVFDTFQELNGIHDISIYPLIMKKNRPGHCIRILCNPQNVDPEKISLSLMKITGSLGVRFYPTNRHKTIREIKSIEITIKGIQFPCLVKIARVGSQIIQLKPEFESLKQIARETGLSILEVQRNAMILAQNIISLQEK